MILKVGRFPTKEKLCEVFLAAEEAGAAAISGINTVPARVSKKDQTPALDENRKTSGVCGYPIRATALNFAKEAREVISENDLQQMLKQESEILELKLKRGADIINKKIKLRRLI